MFRQTWREELRLVKNRATKCGTDRDIAIVGMACVFPGARDLKTFWRNIVGRVDCIGEPPIGNLLHRMYSADSNTNDRVYCKRGGFIEELPLFRAAEYGVMPRAVDGAEPEHFIALQVAHAALTDAGVPDIPLNRERTEVILGRGTFASRGLMSVMQHSLVVAQTIDLIRQLHPEYSTEMLAELETMLKERLPRFSAETASGVCHSVMAGLISNRLNLKGRNLVLDAACASCLQAMEIAVDDLSHGKCDAALVGGVQVSTNVPIYLVFSQLGALSRQQNLRPFDKNADGTMLGEGVGMVVVKRLVDAVRDGNRIYAVVKGVGSSSDGKGGGILAPQVGGEELALRRAYEDASLDPSTIGLIEAHGTGIPLGDMTEISALRKVFGERRNNGRYQCALGSVKSMIGHLIPAAGIAGIIKTSLALHHKVYPPMLCEEPNPALKIDETPFYINTVSRPWVHGHGGYPRRAGVNAFGFGGINSHLVMEEYQGEPDRLIGESWDSELYIFTGRSRKDLIAGIRDFLAWYATPAAGEICLADIAYTLSTYNKGDSRLAIVATSTEDLRDKLGHTLRLLEDTSRVRIKGRNGVFYFEEKLAEQGKLAFMFPGEGSQYVNMLSDICRCFPEARSCFDLLDRAYVSLKEEQLASQFIFPANGMSEEAEKKIFTMDGAVDAVSTANRALFKVLSRLEISPDAIVGHSSGELAALEASRGVHLDGEEDVLSYIQIGNNIIKALNCADDIPYGRLLAVGGAPLEKISEVVEGCEGFLCIAMTNCPHQCVLCGTDETVARAGKELRDAGAVCQELPFQRAYHTELFRPALKRLTHLYEKAVFQVPHVELYSCLKAERYPDDPATIRNLALEQWVKPVLFQETINRMYDDGIRLFVEVGPRANLSSFVSDILKNRTHCTVATNVHHRSGINQLLQAIGLLFAHGVVMNLGRLFENREVLKIELASKQAVEQVPVGIVLNRDLPFIQVTDVDLAAFRTAEKEQQRDAGYRNDKESPVVASHQVQGGAGRFADTTMTEYFRTMEHFLDVQQQTMAAVFSTATETGMVDHAGPAGRKSMGEAPATTGAASRVAGSEARAGGDAGNEQPRSTGPEARMDIRGMLLQLVSERTGYPENMLGLEQDLEAELGIDSIKKVEIVGALIKRLGDLDDNLRQGLGASRTLGQIIDYLEKGIQTDKQPHTPLRDNGEAIGVGNPPPDDSGGTSSGAGGEDIAKLLLRIVSERTGYPENMLGLDQDMEAELGIDSIKRVEIIGVLIRQLEILDHSVAGGMKELRTLGQIIQYLKKNAGEKAVARHPFVTKVSVVEDGRVHEILCTLDLDEYPFLRDHTLGGKVSMTDGAVHGLAILPFSMMLEIVAAAGATLAGPQRLTGFINVSASKWIMFREKQVHLVARVEKMGSDSRILARLYLGAVDERAIALKTEIVYAKSRTPVEKTVPVTAFEDVTTDGILDRFYPLALFHGPMFQNVSAISGWSEKGAKADLRMPRETDLLNGEQTAPLLSSPFCIDAAGQVVGLWASHFIENQYVIFPTSAESISIGSEQVFTNGRCLTSSKVDGNSIRSDIDILQENNSLWGSIKGLCHKRLDIPELVHHFRGSREVLLSDSVEIDLVDEVNAIDYNLSLLPTGKIELSGADGELVQEAIAHIILNPRERDVWHGLLYPENRKREWLFGRVSVKEAVRRLLRQQGFRDVWPADIEISVDRHGRPEVAGTWLAELGWRPLISLSHSEGNIAAFAARNNDLAGVGIDVEVERQVDESLASVVLNPVQQSALAQLGGSDARRFLLMAWCAREAGAKALGRGVSKELNDLKASSIDYDTGKIVLEVPERFLRQEDPRQKKEIHVYAMSWRNIIVACALRRGGAGSE